MGKPVDPNRPPREIWYGYERWKNRRAHQRKIEPLCVMCLADGKVTPARVADHIEDHGGDRLKFEFGKLQSLCVACHNRKTFASFGREPRLTYGLDGWPIESGGLPKE
jgi:5-methylcytosine-specific restriction endonuclease McrA